LLFVGFFFFNGKINAIWGQGSLNQVEGPPGYDGG
jgi:hypothetical protein